MKNRIIILFILFVSCISANLNAKQLEMQVTVLPPVSPLIEDWLTNLYFQAVVTNTTSSPLDFYVQMTFTTTSGFQFTTMSLRHRAYPGVPLILDNRESSSSGLISKQSFQDMKSGDNKDVIQKMLASGIIEEGIYDVCPKLIQADKVTPYPDEYDCFGMIVSHPEQPIIMLPLDYQNPLDANFIIQWSYSGLPSIISMLKYKLRMVEVLDNQTAEQALLANPRILSDVNVITNQYLYNSGADLPLKVYHKYAVKVYQGIKTKNADKVEVDFIPFGEQNGESEVKEFIWGNELNDIEIVSPENMSEHTLGTNVPIIWSSPNVMVPGISYRLTWNKYESGEPLLALKSPTSTVEIINGGLSQKEFVPSSEGKYVAKIDILRDEDGKLLLDGPMTIFKVSKAGSGGGDDDNETPIGLDSNDLVSLLPNPIYNDRTITIRAFVSDSISGQPISGKTLEFVPAYGQNAGSAQNLSNMISDATGKAEWKFDFKNIDWSSFRIRSTGESFYIEKSSESEFIDFTEPGSSIIKEVRLAINTSRTGGAQFEKISGTVLDSVSRRPLAECTVTLVQLKKSMKNGGIETETLPVSGIEPITTSDDGRFEFEIPYSTKTSMFLGYKIEKKFYYEKTCESIAQNLIDSAGNRQNDLLLSENSIRGKIKSDNESGADYSLVKLFEIKNRADQSSQGLQFVDSIRVAANGEYAFFSAKDDKEYIIIASKISEKQDKSFANILAAALDLGAKRGSMSGIDLQLIDTDKLIDSMSETANAGKADMRLLATPLIRELINACGR